MKYIFRCISNWFRDTADLDLFKLGAYDKLVHLYYLTEKPLEINIKTLCMQLNIKWAAERHAIEYVLQRFFTLTADGWIHKGCDQELKAAHERMERKAERIAEWKAKKYGNCNVTLQTQNVTELQRLDTKLGPVALIGESKGLPAKKVDAKVNTNTNKELKLNSGNSKPFSSVLNPSEKFFKLPEFSSYARKCGLEKILENPKIREIQDQFSTAEFIEAIEAAVIRKPSDPAGWIAARVRARSVALEQQNEAEVEHATNNRPQECLQNASEGPYKLLSEAGGYPSDPSTFRKLSEPSSVPISEAIFGALSRFTH